MYSTCRRRVFLKVKKNLDFDERISSFSEAMQADLNHKFHRNLTMEQIDEMENAIASLGKNKISLTTQLEDTKRLGDSEARDRASLLSRFKNLNSEVWCI